MITRFNASRADMFVHYVEGRDGARLRGFRQAPRVGKWTEFQVDPLACMVELVWNPDNGVDRHFRLDVPIAKRLMTTLCGRSTEGLHRTAPMEGDKESMRLLTVCRRCDERFDNLAALTLS